MHNRRHRRNPALFGRSGGKDLLMMTTGVLAGVAATKYLPTLIPVGMSGMFGSNPIMGVVITGAGAFAAGWIARQFKLGDAFADAVLLGGLAQTASALLNVIAPPSISGALALRGVGDIIPGNFVVPQNPLRQAPVMVMPAGQGMGAFRGAFGRGR